MNLLTPEQPTNIRNPNLIKIRERKCMKENSFVDLKYSTLHVRKEIFEKAGARSTFVFFIDIPSALSTVKLRSNDNEETCH